MRISGGPDVTPELHGFLESIEFKVEGPQLSVVRRGFRDGIMKTVAGPAALSGIHHLKDYGFTGWTWHDASGTQRTPDRRAAPKVPSIHLRKLFEQVAGRPMTPSEMAACRREFTAAAAASPQVGQWARGLDLEALHAYDSVYDMADRESSYSWIANEDLSSVAMKRFAREYPLLAGLAAHGNELFEAASHGVDREDAYARLLGYVTARGFPCSAGGYDAVPVGPMPQALLDRLRGLDYNIFIAGRTADAIAVASAVDLARRLPPEDFPRTRREFIGMTGVGIAIGKLEFDRYDDSVDSFIQSAVENGDGFGMKFTSGDLEQMTAEMAASGFDAAPEAMGRHRAMSAMALYGIALAGYGNEVRRHLEGSPLTNDFYLDLETDGFDFARLKDAMCRDGIEKVCCRAMDMTLAPQRPAEQEPAAGMAMAGP